jgi:hypothetical protein
LVVGIAGGGRADSVFLAIEQGEAFAAQSAMAALSAMFAMIAFCVTYAQVAQRTGWPLALTTSLLVWATAAVLLSLIPPSLPLSVIAAATALLAAPHLFPSVQPIPSGPAPKSDKLLLRMIAGALLTLAVTLSPAPWVIAGAACSPCSRCWAA